MRNFLLICFAFTVLFSGCNNKTDQTPLTLRLKYKNGDTNTYLMKTETDGGSMKVMYETEVKLMIDSIYGNGEKYDAALDMIALKMETDMAGEKESYNSSKNMNEMSASEKEMDAEFRQSLNDTVLLTISNKGEAGPMRFANGQSISAANQPIDFSNLQIIFPDKAVSIGEEWTTEKTNPLLDNKTTSTYTIEKVDDDVLYINVKSKIGGIKNALKENTLAGEYRVSKSTGQLIKANLQMPVQSIAGGGKIIYTITAK